MFRGILHNSKSILSRITSSSLLPVASSSSPSLIVKKNICTSVSNSSNRYKCHHVHHSNSSSNSSNAFSIISRGMANHRHKKMIKMAKGYRGRAKSCFSIAKQKVYKALQYNYRDRKVRSREYRKLWIQRINASSRMYGVTYGDFINRLSKSNITLNRKVLSDMAITEPLSFKSIIAVTNETAASSPTLGRKNKYIKQ